MIVTKTVLMFKRGNIPDKEVRAACGVLVDRWALLHARV